jgi:hypothetical protein
MSRHRRPACLRVAKCSAAAEPASVCECEQAADDEERVSCAAEDDSPAAANALQMADPDAGLRRSRPAGGALRAANAPPSAAVAEIRRATAQLPRRQQQVAVCRSTDSTPPDARFRPKCRPFHLQYFKGWYIRAQIRRPIANRWQSEGGF